MDKNGITDELLALVARLCYLDEVPQREVAELVNVSQAKVSRLLAMARERGIVRISVSEYQPRRPDLERQLSGRFNLKDAVVVKARGDLRPEQARRMLGRFAAAALAERLRPGLTVGLAGGRTIKELIEGLADSAGLTVVQLMGNVGPRPEPTDASELGRTLANRGAFLALNAPVFATDAASRGSFLKHEQIRTVMDSFERLDLALVGVGVPGNSIFNGVLSDEQLVNLEKAGVVGEICGRFFDTDGQECDTEFKDRVISVDFAALRRIPKVYGVVSGGDRSEAIAAALKGGLVNALIIDEQGAERLLASQ